MRENSILQKEIFEQPGAIKSLLEQETENIFNLAQQLHGQYQYVTIAARGSSDNAARYAQYVLGTHNQLQVALATPSLFSMYQKPPRLSEALVIGISQSGQSPDIVSVLQEARRQNRPTLSITNDPDSPLAKNSDYIIRLHTGAENAVAATKTYTSSLAALAMISCAFTGDRKRLSELQKIPGHMNDILKNADKITQKVMRYRYMQQCAIIGRGYNYSTAFEIALKIKELTRVVAEPYSSADFRHGPIATVSSGFPVFLIAPSGAISEDITNMLSELTELNAETLVISDDLKLTQKSTNSFIIPKDIPEWLTPLVAVVPGQLFAMQLAIERGLNPDKPEGLRKVTETL